MNLIHETFPRQGTVRRLSAERVADAKDFIHLPKIDEPFVPPVQPTLPPNEQLPEDPFNPLKHGPDKRTNN